MSPTSDAPRTPVFEAHELGPATVAGNELWLITNSARQRERFVTDIREARSRVWLETYIFADDSFGREIAGLLMDLSLIHISLPRSSAVAAVRDSRPV